MAKSTSKNDALSMFNNTNAVKAQPAESKKIASTPTPKVVKEETPLLKEEPTTPVLEKAAPKSTAVGLSLTMNKRAKSMKSRTFYLDDSLYNKLSTLAKENGSSTSEYLSFILEQIL